MTPSAAVVIRADFAVGVLGAAALRCPPGSLCQAVPAVTRRSPAVMQDHGITAGKTGREEGERGSLFQELNDGWNFWTNHTTAHRTLEVGRVQG